MKREIEFDKVPSGMEETIEYLTRFCAARDIEISFNDANGNFGEVRNQSACAYGIDCSRFNDDDADLLLFSVFHELGHMRGIGHVNRMKCIFAVECEAWNWAIERYIMTFGENITEKQAKYMLSCLSTYANGRNFWCPITAKE